MNADSIYDDFAIDVIIQFFDEPLGPELLRRIGEASLAQLAAFAATYERWSHAATTPTRPQGDLLRPFIPRSAHWWLTDPNYAREGMSGVSTTELLRVSALLKTVLLYSHSVALDNPLSRDVALFTVGDGFPREEHGEQFRAELTAFVEFGALVDDLVRSGIIVWLEPAPYASHLAIWRDDRSPELELPIGTHATFEEAYITPLAVRQSVEGCLIYGHDALDVFSPNRLGVEVLNRAVQLDERLASPHGAEAEAPLVAGLLEMDLPAVDDLSFRDILALRRAADSFAAYRSQLRTGIEQSAALAAAHATPQAQARVARELFAPATLAIRRELARTWRSRGADVVTKAAVGAVVGELAHIGIGADSDPSPARLATNVVGDLLMQSRGGRGRRRTAVALAAHYAVFTPTRR